jgi:hypothetical protein
VSSFLRLVQIVYHCFRVDPGQTCGTTAITANTERLVESFDKASELMIIAVLQPDMRFRPEIVVPGDSCEIDQVA